MTLLDGIPEQSDAETSTLTHSKRFLFEACHSAEPLSHNIQKLGIDFFSACKSYPGSAQKLMNCKIYQRYSACFKQAGLAFYQFRFGLGKDRPVKRPAWPVNAVDPASWMAGPVRDLKIAWRLLVGRHVHQFLKFCQRCHTFTIAILPIPLASIYDALIQIYISVLASVEV